MVTEARKRKLEAKIEKSKEVIREALSKFSHASLAITWTGGKDSTLTLWIIRQVCKEDAVTIPKVMTIDEGDTFQEINAILEKYSKKWGINLERCSNTDVINAAGGVLGADVEVAKLNKTNQRERDKGTP